MFFLVYKYNKLTRASRLCLQLLAGLADIFGIIKYIKIKRYSIFVIRNIYIYIYKYLKSNKKFSIIITIIIIIFI